MAQPFSTTTPITPAAVPVAPSNPRGIEMLHGVDMEVTVELGRTQMTVRDLLALSPGAVLELDRAAGSPADLLVNGRLIARGEVVVAGRGLRPPGHRDRRRRGGHLTMLELTVRLIASLAVVVGTPAAHREGGADDACAAVPARWCRSSTGSR